MKILEKPRFFKVTFFASLVLMMETVLFHIVEYIHEFFMSTSVISYAVLGLGLGAFTATRIRLKSDIVFLISCFGTTIALYVVSVVLVLHPALWAIASTTAACVFFPIIYITVLFREYPGGRVYLFDMAGAFLGVAITVILYEFLRSEGIVLFIVSIIPLVALIGALTSEQISPKKKISAAVIFIPLFVTGATLLTIQLVGDTFNIYKIFDRNAPCSPSKIIQRKDPNLLRASYDNLVGRIDILYDEVKHQHTTAYNGMSNDHFTPDKGKEYKELRKKEWMTMDPRVFYGFKKAPRVLIIGAAAQGITKTLKKVTPAENITPIEINPAIIQAMTKDFYKESGQAYRGLSPVVGNAIAFLKGQDRQFDIITLINTHSGPNVGYPAGPDYLHTYEHYNLYLDHLSDKGYMLFEERPWNRGGEFGFYRMLKTLWHVLKERGASDPSQHFFIWEWMVGDKRPNINKKYDIEKDKYVRAAGWYIGMIVSKKPIVGELREKALGWFHIGTSVVRLSYLKDYLEYGEISDVINMIEINDFTKLEEEGMNASILTEDKPFTTLSKKEVPQITRLLFFGSVIFAVLTVIFLIGVLWRSPKKKGVYLCSYNMFIGFGYFLIEIMLMQVYQNVFVSPSWSLVLVLGLLLLSSGVGGMFGGKLKIWIVTALLIPVTLSTIYLPTLVVSSGLPVVLGKTAGVAMILFTGFLLGAYFPRGLVLADRWKMAVKVPHLFAINSVAGSFAVILALYLGIKIGYQSTVIAAVLFYCVAGIMGAQTDTDRQDAIEGN